MSSRAVPATTAVASLVAAWLACGGPGPASAAELLPRALEGVTVRERLGASPDLSGTLTDQDGRSVRLQDLLDGERPLLLTLNYYRCGMICSIQLQALSTSLGALPWADERRVRLATVSIDPRETPKDAASRRDACLAQAGRSDLDWTFLVGDEAVVKRLADQVGYAFRYDEKTDQYAHPATIVFVSPDGRITRYLHGLDVPAQDLKLGVLEASRGEVGTPFDRLVLSCFSYDATAGSYVPQAWAVMRLAGVATVLLLTALLGALWLHERRRAGRLLPALTESA